MSDLKPIDRERLVSGVRDSLPKPVREETQPDGSLVFIGGDPGEVVVKVLASRVTVAIFAVVWEGPHTPTVRPQSLGSLNWRRLPGPRLMTNLRELVESSREIRKAKYRQCERCGETKPPEWMHDSKTCHSCADRHLGVVH